MGFSALAPAAIGASAYAAMAGKLADKDRDPKMNKTAQDFEAMFLSQVFQTMYAGLKGDGPIGGGEGAEVYRSMLADQQGEALAAGGGVGLADQVQREILTLQETAR
jgi:flagellar protein FlgJ